MTSEVTDILYISSKRGDIALSSLFHSMLLPVVRFSLGDKRLFEISEVEKTRVDR